SRTRLRRCTTSGMWSPSSQCGAGGDNEFIPPLSGNDLTKRLCRLPYTYKGRGGPFTGRFFRGSPWEAVRSRRGENRGDAEAQRVTCPPGRAPTRGPTPHRSTPAPTRSTTECILPTKYLPLKDGMIGGMGGMTLSPRHFFSEATSVWEVKR